MGRHHGLSRGPVAADDRRVALVPEAEGEEAMSEPEILRCSFCNKERPWQLLRPVETGKSAVSAMGAETLGGSRGGVPLNGPHALTGLATDPLELAERVRGFQWHALVTVTLRASLAAVFKWDEAKFRFGHREQGGTIDHSGREHQPRNV